jgi:hypothetical protein
MHHIVFIPVAVLCAVSAVSGAIAALTELSAQLARAKAARILAAIPAAPPRPKFTPVVIQGGLTAAVYSRAAQTPLRSPIRAAGSELRAARSLGG